MELCSFIFYLTAILQCKLYLAAIEKPRIFESYLATELFLFFLCSNKSVQLGCMGTCCGAHHHQLLIYLPLLRVHLSLGLSGVVLITCSVDIKGWQVKPLNVTA